MCLEAQRGVRLAISYCRVEAIKVDNTTGKLLWIPVFVVPVVEDWEWYVTERHTHYLDVGYLGINIV